MPDADHPELRCGKFEWFMPDADHPALNGPLAQEETWREGRVEYASEFANDITLDFCANATRSHVHDASSNGCSSGSVPNTLLTKAPVCATPLRDGVESQNGFGTVVAPSGVWPCN